MKTEEVCIEKGCLSRRRGVCQGEGVFVKERVSIVWRCPLMRACLLHEQEVILNVIQFSI